MGATAGTIQGTFGWDNSPLINGMQEAERVTNRGAARIESRFTALFKRSPHRRTELALSGLTSSLVSGDIAGAVTGFAHRLTGIGLAAGVGLGVAVALFEKLHRQIEETRDADEKLQTEMRKPLSTVTSLNQQGMEQALQARIKLGDDLSEKSKHTFGSELAEAFKSTLVGPGAPSRKDLGRERMEQQERLNQNEADKKAIMEAQAKLAEKLVGIRRQELEGDERQAAIAKIMLETDQARAALKQKGLSNAAFKIAEKALLQNEELSLHQVDKKANAREADLAMREKIARAVRGGLGGDELKQARAALEIKSIEREISGEKDPTRRRELEATRSEMQNNLRSLAPEKSRLPFGTTAARGLESQFGAGGFARRGIEDSLGFGGLARGSIDRGESLTPEEALLKTGTSATDIAGFKKNVGDLPGGKTGDAAVLAVMIEIKTIIEQAWAK